MSAVNKQSSSSSSSSNNEMSPRNNHDPTSSGESGSTNVQEADLQEMEDVNQSLDALSCALDAVEQRTDDILSQLRLLLDSNREIRRELAEVNEEHNDSRESDDHDDDDDHDDELSNEMRKSSVN